MWLGLKTLCSIAVDYKQIKFRSKKGKIKWKFKTLGRLKLLNIGTHIIGNKVVSVKFSLISPSGAKSTRFFCSRFIFLYCRIDLLISSITG